MRPPQIYMYRSDEEEFDRMGKFMQMCEKCKKENVILTQPDKAPEYYTTVFTFCSCGNEIEWKLPVN